MPKKKEIDYAEFTTLAIFDLDGVLVDTTLQNVIRSKEFFKSDVIAVLPPVVEYVRTAKSLQKSGVDIHFVTGRGESLRGATIDWLTRHGLIDSGHLHMQGTDPSYSVSDIAAYKADTLWSILREYKEASKKSKLSLRQCVVFEDTVANLVSMHEVLAKTGLSYVLTLVKNTGASHTAEIWKQHQTNTKRPEVRPITPDIDFTMGDKEDGGIPSSIKVPELV